LDLQANLPGRQTYISLIVEIERLGQVKCSFAQVVTLYLPDGLVVYEVGLNIIQKEKDLVKRNITRARNIRWQYSQRKHMVTHATVATRFLKLPLEMKKSYFKP
jgi:hypothetical protein